MTIEIVAEIAQGYEGDPTLARLLTRAAGRAGADSVKFQLIYADEICTPDYKYYDLLRSLEMPLAGWEAVRTEARRHGLRLYLDVYGERSLDEALALGVDGAKIHSTDFFNTPLIRAVLARMPSVFVSLGGVSVAEHEEFIAAHAIAPGRVCFMYGFQAEPTPLDANHLRRLGALRARFPGHRFGFMDHAEGDSDEALTLALLSLPFGVECIEKHLTLDRALELEDHVSALTPGRFARFVQAVRRHEPALGSDDLTLTAAERAYRDKAFKAVVTRRALPRGERLEAEALVLKRTSQSDSATAIRRLDAVVGRTLSVDVAANQQLAGDMFQ